MTPDTVPRLRRAGIGSTRGPATPITRAHASSHPSLQPMRAADWLLLLALSVLWGATFFFVAIALQELPPLTLVVARVGLAALMLAPVLRILGVAWPPRLAAWRSYAVLAIFNNILPFSLIFYGQTRIASALAAVLNATTPLFTLIVARLFAGEVLTPAKVCGVLLGVLGVGVLMGVDAASADVAGTLGALCVLGAALSYALATLWMRRLQDQPPLASAEAQLIC